MIRPAKIFFLASFFLFLPTHPSLFANPITDEAQKIYQQSQASVYQVQVIDIATGKKSTIGSGFQFHPTGLIATNYHVLSHAIQSPSRYRVEYIRHDGIKGLLKILDYDVVHDIGIAQTDAVYDGFLELGDAALSKGAKIFSMGNPYDLGMTIIEGIYNGLMERSLYRKILFSGSLNAGMSGGPALDHEGRVIGVNVSTQGNQISFLVPVDYLNTLYEAVAENDYTPVKDWKAHVQKQLLENQTRYVDKILLEPWDSVRVGDTLVPGEISQIFKCWGNSREKKKELYEYAFINCSTEDEIFLLSSLTTGQIIYKYNWMISRGLSPVRFYKQYEKFYMVPHSYTNAYEKDVTNFSCHTDFVDIDNKDFRVSFCARNYKDFPKLYDINLSMVSVDEPNRGLMAEVIALGLSRDKAKAFIGKFLKEIKWPKS